MLARRSVFAFTLYTPFAFSSCCASSVHACILVRALMFNVARVRALSALKPFPRTTSLAYRPASSVFAIMSAKRKRSTVAAASAAATVDALAQTPLLDQSSTSPSVSSIAPKRRATSRGAAKVLMNPDNNADVLDAPDALRASPDSDVNEDIAPGPVKMEDDLDSPLSEVPDLESPKNDNTKRMNGAAVAGTKTKANMKTMSKAGNDDPGDPEADGDEEAGEEEIQEALSRPPPVNSSYLPLPWKGRLGYVSLICGFLCGHCLPVAGLPQHLSPL